MNHSTMKWMLATVIVYALSISGVMLRAQVPLEVGKRDRSIPEGTGQTLVMGACTQCHSLGPIVLQRKTAARWGATVRDMISRGAQLQSEEIDVVTAYLAEHYGPEVPPEAGAEKPPSPQVTQSGSGSVSLPEGDGKALIIKSCTECHGLNRITEARKDTTGWQATVRDMIQLGAKLRPEDVPTVVSYLATNFNRQSQPATNVKPEQIPDRYGMGRAPDDNSSMEIARQLPDGEGKGLILASCVQCHNLRYLVGLRKSDERWKHTVDDMVARGAQLSEAEAETVVRYLTQYLAKQ